MEELFGVGVEAGRGIRRAVGGAGHSLFVYGDVKFGDWTQLGINDIGHGHDVEQGWSGIAVGENPLKVQRGECVGERRAGGKEQRSLVFIQEQLGGVERHHEDRNATGKKLLRGGDVAINVVLGLRAVVDAVAEIAVAAFDGAAHQHDALEFAESCQVFVNRFAQIGERADGYERDFAGEFGGLLEKKFCGFGMLRRSLALLGPIGLREFGGGAGSGADQDGDGSGVGFLEEAVDETSAKSGVAPGGGDAENLDFGATQCQSQSEGVVNVVADVGVEDDFGFGGGRRGHSRLRAEVCRCDSKQEHNSEEVRNDSFSRGHAILRSRRRRIAPVSTMRFEKPITVKSWGLTSGQARAR